MLGLEGTPDTILRMACALLLLPGDQFLRGADEIRRFILEDPARPHLQSTIEFSNYLVTSWGPIANIVSVHQRVIRTNNYAESFYKHSLRKLGGIHPNIYTFLRKFVNI